MTIAVEVENQLKRSWLCVFRTSSERLEPAESTARHDGSSSKPIAFFCFNIIHVVEGLQSRLVRKGCEFASGEERREESSYTSAIVQGQNSIDPLR